MPQREIVDVFVLEFGKRDGIFAAFSAAAYLPVKQDNVHALGGQGERGGVGSSSSCNHDLAEIEIGPVLPEGVQVAGQIGARGKSAAVVISRKVEYRKIGMRAEKIQHMAHGALGGVVGIEEIARNQKCVRAVSVGTFDQCGKIGKNRPTVFPCALGRKDRLQRSVQMDVGAVNQFHEDLLIANAAQRVFHSC